MIGVYKYARAVTLPISRGTCNLRYLSSRFWPPNPLPSRQFPTDFTVLGYQGWKNIQEDFSIVFSTSSVQEDTECIRGRKKKRRLRETITRDDVCPRLFTRAKTNRRWQQRDDCVRCFLARRGKKFRGQGSRPRAKGITINNVTLTGIKLRTILNT